MPVGKERPTAVWICTMGKGNIPENQENRTYTQVLRKQTKKTFVKNMYLQIIDYLCSVAKYR
jgi:hypothetical protein